MDGARKHTEEEPRFRKTNTTCSLVTDSISESLDRSITWSNHRNQEVKRDHGERHFHRGGRGIVGHRSYNRRNGETGGM